MSSVESRLQKLDEKMLKLLDGYKKLEEVNKNMQALHRSFEAFNKDFEVFRKEFEVFKKEGNDMKVKFGFLEAENVSMKSEVKSLRITIEELHSVQHASDLELSGVTPTSGENLRHVVHEIGKKAEVNLADHDIKRVERKIGRNSKVGNICVSFSSPLLRNDYLNKVKKLKLKCCDIGIAGSSANVYANDCLSSYSRSLLYQAKLVKAGIGFKYLWVRDGKIFMRKAENEHAIRVASFEDLAHLKK